MPSSSRALKEMKRPMEIKATAKKPAAKKKAKK